MSTESHNTTSHKGEHGTILSYVVGFILSLLYTILPYQLVMHKTISGTALIVTILGIALLQMAIQLLFFLHLGRGPKPFYNIVFFFATFGVIVITIGASLFIMNNLYQNMSPHEVTKRLAQEENIAQIGGKDTGACVQNKENHTMTIKDGIVTPSYIAASRCDTLSFVNEDGLEYRMHFGLEENEAQSYGGHFEIPVRADKPEVITLNETGLFRFYDAQDSNVSGQFFVE